MMYSEYGSKRLVVKGIAEALFIGLYSLSFLLFALMCMGYGADYSDAIDPDDSGYSPLGISQFPTLYFYLVMFWISGLLLWLKEVRLSPVLKVIALGFLGIGIFISGFVIAQVSAYNDPNESMPVDFNTSNSVMFAVFPFYSILVALVLILKHIKEASHSAYRRKYKNPLLNRINSLMITMHSKPLFLILVLLPLLLVSTGILILFGQSPDSLVKAFTDTTCWRFSQMSHPDYLTHQGHYLCTVAARGNAKIVKPLRVGQRHGKKIIVNRQLLIANAFESVIEKHASKLHSVIRKTYDQYGFPLAKYINTPWLSNLTYFLMKPLEWFFLLILYMVCEKPETVINNQYSDN